MSLSFVPPTVFCAAVLASACGSPKQAASAMDASPSLDAKDAQALTTPGEDQTASAAALQPKESAPPGAADPQSKDPTEKTVADNTALDTYVVPQGPNQTFQVIHANLSKIRACYMRDLTTNKDIKGSLEVEFTINMKGRIAKTRVIKNELNASVATCVVEELKTLKYPKPKYAPETFRFPFNFSPTS